MKDRELEEALDRGFTRHGEPSPEQVAADLACNRERIEGRAFRLKAEATAESVATPGSVDSAFRRKAATRWLQLAAAAALVLAATVGTAIVWRAADDPLFRVVEGNVYQEPKVWQALQSKDVVAFKVDLTNSNAPGKSLLLKLNPAGGIPLTAIYPPRAEQPLVLASIYSTATLLEALDQVTATRVAKK